MNDREIKGLAIVGGAVLLGFALLNGVYQAGVNAGLDRDGDVDRGWGFGCFPFPLLLIGGVVLFLVWRRRGGFGGPGGPGGPGFGPGGGRPPRFFEEWHRKAHEAGPDAPPAPAQAPRPEGGAPTGTPTAGPSGAPTGGPTGAPSGGTPTGGGPAQGGMV